MDILKAEIERKKRQKRELEEQLAKKNSNNNGTDNNATNGDTSLPQEDGQPKKKYVRLGDLEKLREQKYLEELEQEKLKRAKANGNGDSDQKKEEPDKKPAEVNPLLKLPIEEIFRRLRSRGQPVTYFGETDEERADRLHRLEEREPIERESGSRNDFNEFLRELDEEEESSKDKKKKEKGKDKDKEKGKEKDSKEKEQPTESGQNSSNNNEGNGGEAIPSVEHRGTVDSIHGEEFEVKSKEDFILHVLKFLLRTWDQELEERSDIQRRSAQGKIDTATYKQCKKYIKPLFKLLRKRQLPLDILTHVHEITLHLQSREYVRAHDAYLKMAIGNAPWPMGVTMVGIHERSGREKIFSNQIAHVLNDETQRKYIQSLKRLMSYAQRRFATDPSKTVG